MHLQVLQDLGALCIIGYHEMPGLKRYFVTFYCVLYEE